MSGKGKLLHVFFSERSLSGRRALANPCWSGGGKQLQVLQRRSKHWDGVKGNSVGRSGFWPDVNLCKGFSTSRVAPESVGELASVAAEAGEESVSSGDQALCEGRLDGVDVAASLEVASLEVEGNAERETDGASLDMDGNA